MQIEGKRVIVTGGSSGMGAAAVRVFVRHGALVASLDLQDEAGAQIVAAANAEGPGRATYHHCDVQHVNQVGLAFEQAVDDLDGLDALVHAAGVDREAPAESMDEEEWDLVLDVNAKSTFVVNQAAFPYLRDNGGRIINFGSGAAQILVPGRAHYAASKAAVMAWSRCIAAEWGRYGINVVSLAPVAETPMLEAMRSSLSDEDRATYEAGVVRDVPLGRVGDPEAEIAPVLVFLLSDAARFITAQVIAVDGGMVPVR
jgi:NAD(P)-dependent dehydrogenase (short-subunit alcohol dehydrogenase family)